MNTVKRYRQDAYLKKFTAHLTEATPCEGGFILVLDETAFFPTGGGQSCDKGAIQTYPVVDVYEKQDVVYHQIQCADSKIVWDMGMELDCEIDWERRFLNMQRHCGEHILSGIFYREYGGVNRGFHMGAEYMTIDISLEENADYQILSWDMAARAELLANQVIWSNAPVTVRHFETREEAADLPLRKALALEEDISIVCVGDIQNPSDCVACCGTHPSTAGQVGVIKILKVESYKGMFRIYCEAGKSAIALFDQYHDLVARLGQKYSATAEDLWDKIAVQEEKSKAAKSELHFLKQSIIHMRVAEIRKDLENIKKDADTQRFLIKEYGDLKVDDLLNIGRPLVPELKLLLLIVSRPHKTLLLFSDGKIDCGKLVKENADIYQGKGGGNNTSARAMFPKEESLDTFMDLLEKHLR